MTDDFAPVLRALGSEIRAEADFRGIALGELAEAAQVNRSTLYLYLNNRRTMPLDVLLAIAKRLSISVDVLLDRADQRASRDAQSPGDAK